MKNIQFTSKCDIQEVSYSAALPGLNLSDLQGGNRKVLMKNHEKEE